MQGTRLDRIRHLTIRPSREYELAICSPLATYPTIGEPITMSAFSAFHFVCYNIYNLVQQLVTHIGEAWPSGLHVCLVMRRSWARVPSKFLSKKLYPYCLVLVSCRNGFERDFTIELT